MDAMKRIISMVAKGKDVSELFPAVVKNVAVKNLELKKLVYVYLVRYAEEQQDLALLSVSTFQKALQDPNQLIRASALRVLSSIRVPMITTVMLLALKASVRDMSAYVRKVAAHAIPKLYSLNQDLLTDLLECIDYLLGDKRTLVLGSAVYAFEETCPDRLDLLHKHFRSLCRALADVDEWGQIIMVGLLTRYSRTQFTSPRDDQEQLDPDHTLLILSARPLLQSRNCSVVMAVAQLLYYIAPPSQLSVVPKALVRLLRGPNEVQYVVLVNIATICATRNNMVDENIFAISKNLFEPFLKSFFVRSSDSMHVKLLKLQVLTSLVTETNVQLVIRELQAYLQMSDLASAAIEAIGRCALHISGSSDTCLSCLINLISSPKENIVCASVVVLKRLLHADAPIPLLKRVIKLIHSIRAPPARACVIWLISTHIEKVPTLAPDLLRILAKTFCDEADIVKLQILNLAIRLWATDRSKCELLVKYVIQLARYDRSYDIRDRCRFLRNLLLKDDSKFPLKIFMTDKPAPAVHSQYSDRENFQLGTLSHLLNQKCNGYTELPDFPEIAPDPTVRRSAMPLSVDEIGKDALKGQKGELDKFYSDDESDEEEDEDEEDEDEEDDDDDEEA
uniref:AP complex subunit beta n=1 Tax=Panagrolaimus davidi TaxID=227884 RepID=A0A914QZD4_9BILA